MGSRRNVYFKNHVEKERENPRASKEAEKGETKGDKLAETGFMKFADLFRRRKKLSDW